jgi:hypothetical protein
MNEFSFSSVLTGGFTMSKVKTVVNADASQFSWSKPMGGVWLATMNDYGSDSWSELLGLEEEEAADSRQEFTLRSDAKIVVIRSEADYKELLDNYPYYPDVNDSEMTADIAAIYGSSAWSIFNSDSSVRRNVDYSKLSKDYDAVLLTWQGLGPYKRNFSNYNSTDISLYSWDIESMFVMNPSILTVK